MSVYKRVFKVRVKFHDWLWGGAAKGKRIRKWIAPKLPEWLEDPYMDGIRDFQKHPENWKVVETTGPPPKVRMESNED